MNSGTDFPCTVAAGVFQELSFRTSQHAPDLEIQPQKESFQIPVLLCGSGSSQSTQRSDPTGEKTSENKKIQPLPWVASHGAVSIHFAQFDFDISIGTMVH